MVWVHPHRYEDAPVLHGLRPVLACRLCQPLGVLPVQLTPQQRIGQQHPERHRRSCDGDALEPQAVDGDRGHQ